MAVPTLQRFLSGMLATGIGSLSVVVMGMLGLMISARVLPAEALGAFFLLQVLVVFASEASSIGIHMALERELPGVDEAAARRRLISTAFAFRLLTALPAALLLVLSAPALFALLEVQPSRALVAVTVSWFLLEALLKLLLSHHQACFAFRAIGATNVLSSFVNFAVILLLVLGWQQGLMGLLVAKLLSRLAALAYAWTACRPALAPVLDPALLRRMLRYCLPLYANFLVTFASVRGDTLLIGGLLGTGAVAFYEVARRIPDSLMQFYEAFRQVYFPFAARQAAAHDTKAVSQLASQATRFGALLLFAGCLLVFAYGEAIIVLLFSATYAESALPFALLTVAASLMMLESTLGATLAAIGESDKPLLINLVRTALQVLAYLLLIPALGLTGAALAAVAAAVAVLPVNLYFLRRRGVRVPGAGIATPLLLAAGLALPLWLLGQQAPLAAAMLVLAYGPLALACRVVTRSELGTAARWLRGRLAHGRVATVALAPSPERLADEPAAAPSPTAETDLGRCR